MPPSLPTDAVKMFIATKLADVKHQSPSVLPSLTCLMSLQKIPALTDSLRHKGRYGWLG